MNEADILDKALKILERRAKYNTKRDTFNDPQVAIHYFRMRLVDRKCEYFCIAYLDNRHRLIHVEDMFRGTIDGASVHPREVVKEALNHNAAAVILAHNHPSGDPNPSASDKVITNKLRDALGVVDIRILDHIVVGSEGACSFAQMGLI